MAYEWITVDQVEVIGAIPEKVVLSKVAISLVAERAIRWASQVRYGKRRRVHHLERL